MTPDELKRFLEPVKHECHICGKIFITLSERERCIRDHAREQARMEAQKKWEEEHQPEPDEALVGLLEAMVEVKYDGDDKSSR